MDTLPCQDCKGLCCGPVPITNEEFKRIKRKVKSLPQKYRSDLESQKRYFGTCIFYDLDKDKCGIYSERPGVCRSFGYHKNLVCFKNPSLAKKENYQPKGAIIGTLSTDFTWKDFK